MAIALMWPRAYHGAHRIAKPGLPFASASYDAQLAALIAPNRTLRLLWEQYVIITRVERL